MTITACSALSPFQKTTEPNKQEEYAERCYNQGIRYLNDSRYELARRQFSIAAASATSKTQYLKAAEGVRRVERIMQLNR